MKKLILATTFMTAFASPALASNSQMCMFDGVYVAGKFVYDYQRVENIRVSAGNVPQYTYDRKDRTTGGALALGYDFNNKLNMPIRAELEATIRNSFKTSGAKIGHDTYMVNAYYDFHNNTPFTPYIGAGVGSSRVDFKISNPSFTRSDTSRDVVWNVGTGVSYEITKNISADVGYRYMDYGHAKFSQNIGNGNLRVKADDKAHEVLIGFRYNF